MFTLKHSLLQLAALLVMIVASVMVLWKTQGGKESPDSVAERGELRIAERIADSQASFSEEEFEANIQASSEEATLPRVSAADSVPTRLVVKDDKASTQERNFGSVDAQKSGGRVPVTSLRTHLLREAAERALHSETPWSDLSVVALGFRKAGDEKAALYWFDRASRLSQDPQDSLMTSKAMREVARSLISGNYLPRAQELTSRIPESAEKDGAQLELARAYARGQQFEEARALAGSMSSENVQAHALRSIAESEARHLGISDVRDTLALIRHRGLREEAFGRVATVFARAGELDEAMELVNRMTNEKARDAALTRVASFQPASGGALAALIRDPSFRDEALREMVANEMDRRRMKTAESAAYRIKNETERAKAYESLVLLQLRYRDFDGALKRAQSIHVEASRHRAFQAVALAHVKEYGAPEARNIAHLIGDHDLRETTLGKIASRASVVGKSREAVETISFMGDPSERAVAFASVALTQAKHGDDRMAKRLAHDADRELDEVSSDRDQARAKEILAEVHVETGDAHSAFQTVASIDHGGLRDRVYQKMAVQFAKSEDAELAEQSASLIEREGTRQRALDTVATALAGKVAAVDALKVVSHLDNRRQQVRFLVAVAARKS